MGFKKLFKKARKALGIPAVTLGNVAKLGVIAGTGGTGAVATALAAKAIKSRLKTAGASAARVLRTKAEKAIARKLTGAHKANPNVDMKATTMPGGAPLPSTRAPVRRVAAAKRAKAPRKASGKRSAPKGGKDLKALSASWKKAGKPGSWMSWVKSH